MILDKLLELGIEIGNRSRGQFKTKCPKCSEERKKKSDPCLSVNLDEGIWNCHNCGWHGRVYEKQEKTYVLPLKNNTGLSDKVLEWFNKRGIGNATIKSWDITESEDNDKRWINFNYYRDGELVNVKYRDNQKNFRMAKGAELIFYGLDKIKGNKECIICEGELDSLAYYEANVLSVCSVPNGASKGNQRLEYLDNCWQEFKDFEKIYIATDNDEPGLQLRNELARRLGKYRCVWVDFGDCKDANEYLLKYGADALKKTLEKNTKQFPIDGIVALNDFEDQVDEIYLKGFPRGMEVGHFSFDDHLRYLGGQCTLVVGYAASGKSEVVDQIVCSLAYRYEKRFGFFSSENMPYEFHFTKLAEKYKYKRWSDFTDADLREAKSWISEHFLWTAIDEEVDLTIDYLLEKFAELVVQKGVWGFVIDPWNEIDHDIPHGMSETQYVSRVMKKIVKFCRKYDAHVWVIVHPTKPFKNKDGKVPPPKLSDAAGSMNFVNKAYNGFVVYRNFEENTVEAIVQKVKFKFLGKVGHVPLEWNGYTGGTYWQLNKIMQHKPNQY
jgi:twinkle protein